MRIEFLTEHSPERPVAEAHIRDVYARIYGARITGLAPVLAAAFNAGGEILCAAGLRTAEGGFFSDRYLDEGGFDTALRQQTGLEIDPARIMEVTSLASVSPFPVLPLLDHMIGWGRDNGMICGVFTATLPLRRLLTRTGLHYSPLCAAQPERLENAADWGSYYEADPWVCAVIENEGAEDRLTPAKRSLRHKEAS